MSFKNANQQIQRFVLGWGNLARSYEIIRALVDARRFNSTITERDNGPDGKLREFQMSYIPVQCDATGSCTDGVCDTGTRIAPKQIKFKPAQCTASPVYEIGADDLREIDGNYTFSDHAIGMINAALPTVRRNLALDMAAILVANAGLQPDGNATRRINFVNSTNGTINPVGQWEVERTFQDAGFNPPTIVGSGEVFTWQKAQAAAGLNAQGLNLTRLGQTNSYYDALVAQAVGDGADHVYAFDPQVLKFVTWSKNAGMFATDVTSLNALDTMYAKGNPQRLRGVLRDPATGLAWDLDLHFDPCGGTDEEGIWKFQLKLRWDIFFMPEIACNIQGVNGIFHFTTCPAVLAPCPVGDAIPAAAESATFQWNPDIDYPMYVAKAVIAGRTTSPNVSITSDADLVAMLNDNSNIAFTLNGANVEYTGYSAIDVDLNDGVETATFA